MATQQQQVPVVEGDTPAPPEEEQAPTTEATKSESDRQDALRKAYSAATKGLREKYRDEFTALYVEEARKLGVEYTPPKTPAQKAEEEMAALLQQFPELREKIAPAAPVQSPPAPGA